MAMTVLPSSSRRAWCVRGFPILLGLSFAAAAIGCVSYPESDERIDEEIVYTYFDDEAEFGDYKTFSVSAEVTIFSEDDGELEREPLDESSAKKLIDRVTKHMEDRGYTQVEATEDPDLGLTLSILNGQVTGYYSSYWPGYWGYYGWYYYYPYAVTYSYETSTLLLDAADLKAAGPPPEGPPPIAGGDAEGALNVSWLAAVYGVSSSTNSENLSRALDGIDQAFKQSPYLEGN